MGLEFIEFEMEGQIRLKDWLNGFHLVDQENLQIAGIEELLAQNPLNQESPSRW